MTTLLLDNQAWDLIADARGNIALAADPYAMAQDVASACRLFLGECWYDNRKGVPYFEDILGQAPPAGLFESYMVQAALTVPGVVDARCTIQQVQNRRVTATVTFTDAAGQSNQVTLQ